MSVVSRIFRGFGGHIVVATVSLHAAVAQPLSDIKTDAVDQSRTAPLNERDSRRNVEIFLSPYAAVGRFTGTMVCTAAMVLHPRIIVTTAHCVAERDGTATLSDFSFHPGHQADVDLGRFKATVWAVGSLRQFTSQSVRDAANDWAVLLLDQAPVGIRPFLLGRTTARTLMVLEQQLLLPSYSGDLAGVPALNIDPACSVIDVLWGVLAHDCTVRAGASGAPLLVRHGRWYAVVGIHSGSMAVRDAEHGAMKFIGNSAIGVSAFAEAVHSLLRNLNNNSETESSAAH